MTLTQTVVAKSILATAVLGAFFVGISAYAATPLWNTSGTYVAAFNYLGTDYTHDMVLTQSATGTLTGHGGSPVGANTYTWDITSGSVSGNVIDFVANYTAPADAVTPLTTMHVMGTIASSGMMSGTWSDNYQGGMRSGSWQLASGSASAITATLAPEDFGVVNYDTGLGILKGYTAGFGLSGANLMGAQSVVVKLYSSSTLLQTNTAIIPKFNADVLGVNFSSPFDVSGDFNYAADGYWVNTRETQYGKSLPATRVMATVTLANGQVVTAENTVLTGDPTTIYGSTTGTTTPPTTGTSTPKSAAQCKNNGWQSFTNPTFKNQGQCVSYVEHQMNGGHQGTDDTVVRPVQVRAAIDVFRALLNHWLENLKSQIHA